MNLPAIVYFALNLSTIIENVKKQNTFKGHHVFFFFVTFELSLRVIRTTKLDCNFEVCL